MCEDLYEDGEMLGGDYRLYASETGTRRRSRLRNLSAMTESTCAWTLADTKIMSSRALVVIGCPCETFGIDNSRST